MVKQGSFKRRQGGGGRGQDGGIPDDTARIAFVAVIALILAGMAGYFWVYPYFFDGGDDAGEGDDDGGDGTPVIDDEEPDGEEPDGMTFDIGSGSEDWWTSYPSQSVTPGASVPHIEWVLENVENRPTLLFVHSTTCEPCELQAGYIEDAEAMYGSDVYFEDILADGTNPLADEIFSVYDPNGPPNYIPLTVIVTYGVDDYGNTKLVWHSVEGATSLQWLVNYLDDARVYYDLYP